MPKSKRKIRDGEEPVPSETKRRKEDCEMTQQEAEIAVQAKQSSPIPRRNDSDEESDLREFKEIPPEDITVAIFCALSYESVAVKYSLDEEFECRPKTIGPAKYVYSFGLIGEHKVVIARPHQMGTVGAAQCAATVCQQFPNVKFALMVGIGAGIPCLPKRDIRLGDIAVSIPRDNHPGVLEYDFGKYEADGTFVRKGSLDKPPLILIGADGSLEDDEMMSRSPLRRILRDIAKQPGYARPKGGDVLFYETFHHVNKGGDCSGCEASSEKKVVPRDERDKKPGQPVVHRGLILSGNGVVKNPNDRVRLRRGRDDAICFEMEAAGIMDEIRCLVVRGICDYADTHKQDGWHHYAAAAAAAYAKALLRKIHGQDVENMGSMRDKRKCEKHDTLGAPLTISYS
jgi:nucleoside phosphorylase